jgi:hypothetical protein
MWHLHYFSSLCYYSFSFYVALALQYFSSLCYYFFSFFVAPALLLFHLLLFLLLCDNCTISLPSALIPSPSKWQLHYFSSFYYYSFSFYLELALILFLLVLFNSIIYLSSFLPFSPLPNHNLLPLSLPLSAFAYYVTPYLHSYHFALISFVHPG